MKRGTLIILVIGIILRIFLSAVTYHSDLVPFDFAGKLIKGGNITNFYDYLWQIPQNDPILKIYPRNLFNYPPLPYFFLGGTSLLTTWLISPVVHESFIFNFSSILGNPELNFLLFLLKLPYFFFDIAIAFLLMKFFDNDTQKRLVFALWFFNPVNLYATYMVGQFDIIPTMLTVVALFLAVKKDNFTLASVMLGFGASFKIFPLLFIIPLAFIKKGLWQRITLIAIAFGTYIVTAFPFIMSSGFRKTAMLAGQTTKSLYAQIPISGGESVILFLAVVIFMYIVFYYRKIQIEYLWQNFFIMILVFFIFTHFHPQWFLWTMPFFVLDLVQTKLKHLPLFIGLLVTYIGMITFFDSGLSVGLFAPINASLYNLPDLWKIFGLNIDINMARSILQTTFVGISVYYIYYYFPKDEKQN